MIGQGQAEAANAATTKAPKGMYVKMEPDDNVARGCVRVKELIAYDFDRMEKEKDEHTGKYTGREIPIEKGRKPCFCQTAEDEAIYRANNPKARIESFDIQLLESTAIEKLNDPENMKQFIKKGVNYAK